MAISFLSEGGGLPRSLSNRKKITLPTKPAVPTPAAKTATTVAAPTGFKPIELSKAYGAIDKYFKAPLKDLGYSGSVLQANPAFLSAAGIGDPTIDATMLNPGFAEWAAANGVTADLLKGSKSNTLRLLQNGIPFAEKTYTTKNDLDKFVEVAGPIALAIGTGGVLGQALGFIPGALNPLDPATWGAAAGGSGAATGGAGAGAGGGAITTGGAQGAAALEAAVAADIAAAQTAAASSLGVGGGLTATELAALGVGGAGATGAGAGLATLPAQATGAFTPVAAQTLPTMAGVSTPAALAGTGATLGAGAAASGVDKILSAIGTAGSNLVNKAIENPLQTAALVGSVGALAGAKPSKTPGFDAEAAAAAQGEANREASWFDAVLNRPDMQTPWGSSTWTLREGADPKNPKPGDWVNTVALNAEQQGLLDAQNRLSAGYASTAEGMLGRVQDTYGQGLDLSGIPGMPDFSRAELDLSGLGAMPDFSQLGLDLSGLVDMPDFASLNTDNDRQRIEDALFARLEPLLQQEEERARTRLLNTGFEYGSEGSNIELDRLARGRNDARLAAILFAGDEASRLMGDQRSNMLAQLQARGQGLSEALAESGVDLQSLQGMLQTRGQGLDEARSSSNSILRAMMAQLQGRQQGFSEATYQRNLPLNELNAFRQGSQVQAPEFQSIIPTNTAASPELDALLAQLGVRQGNAANSQAGYNALLQAIAGLGSAWIGG